MTLGILKDTKKGEHRVICTPVQVRSIVQGGHKVYVQHDCGAAAGFPDEQYVNAGAEVLYTAKEIFGSCDMVAKVKELTPSEYPLIRENQIILACLHPALNPLEVDAILESKCIAFTAEDSHRYGSPNCEAAGKVGALAGLESMLTVNGGKGMYVGGFAGAPSMRVLILGGGLVGQGALSVLYALGARCTVMDINVGVLRKLSDAYRSKIDTVLCNKQAIASILPYTDMVINCVKWQKDRRDFLIDREMLKLMEKGSVIVDVSNDNPGAIESSHETDQENPRYTVNGVVHYCVSNIPSAVANSASVAYGAAILPMIQSLLSKGVKESCICDGYFRRSLVAYKGHLTHEETSALQQRPWIRPEDALGISDLPIDHAPAASSTRSKNFLKF